jgi:hypothetical protein
MPIPVVIFFIRYASSILHAVPYSFNLPIKQKHKHTQGKCFWLSEQGFTGKNSSGYRLGQAKIV